MRLPEASKPDDATCTAADREGRKANNYTPPPKHARTRARTHPQSRQILHGLADMLRDLSVPL